MGKDVKWVSRNGKTVEKVTTKTDSKGNKEIVRQKAYDGWFSRGATKVISRTKITK